MFSEVCERQARLAAEWLRVGYCQGNLNSDNSALGGFTLDYGLSAGTSHSEIN